MAEVTLEKLADDIGTPVDKLIKQFADAGISKGEGDQVSEDEKQQLLSHLKASHGADEDSAPSKMTLRRKTKSTLSVTGSQGKSKSVQVEVRKKRTYVKRSALELEEAATSCRLKQKQQKKRVLRLKLKRKQKASRSRCA